MDWIDDSFSDDDLQVLAESVTSNHRSNASRKVTGRKRQLQYKENPLKERSQYDELWVTKYSPRTISQVAGNKAKIDQLADWFAQTVVAGSNLNEKILLVSGPSGCGKTAAVQAICNDLKIRIHQWTGEATDYVPPEQRGDNSLFYQSQSALLDAFLVRANRYRQVPLVGSEQVTQQVALIEDIPHTLIRSPAEWHNKLRRYRNTARSVLVLIFNTSGEASERLMFPDSLKQELAMVCVSFNPIPKTDMKRVLTAIVGAEPVADITADVIAALSESCNGDVRSAINTLQFSYSRSDRSAVARRPLTKRPRRGSASTTKQKKNLPSALTAHDKDPTLILFRALGKVLYCKREESQEACEDLLPAHLKHHARAQMSFVPEQVFEQSKVSSEFYTLCLHHNYPSFLPNLENACRASGYLADSDTLSERFKSREVEGVASASLSLAARGLMHSNTSVKRKHSWQPMRKPEWYAVRRKVVDLSAEISSLNQSQYPVSSLAVDVIPLLQIPL